MAVSESTKRKLFTLSGNQCAFPGCTNPIFDTEHDVMVGQICHIKAQSPGGPRYDPMQSPAERDGFENLILMCSAHNKIIDDPHSAEAFPFELLIGYKREHEQRFHNTVVRPDLLQHWIEISKRLERPIPAIVPVVDSWMTGADNSVKIDRYDFRIKLKNEGETTVRAFRLEVEVPNAYANPTHSSVAEVRNHNRGDVTLYRRTERELRDFVLYPDDTSDYVLLLDYQLLHDQYQDVNESIKVLVYSDDAKVSVTEYPIRKYRNKDRMDQLGLS
jgi:hypothetical protein